MLNTDTTKMVVFRKGGILPRNLKFYYNGTELEIVSYFSYLGIWFFFKSANYPCSKTFFFSSFFFFFFN